MLLDFPAMDIPILNLCIQQELSILLIQSVSIWEQDLAHLEVIKTHHLLYLILMLNIWSQSMLIHIISIWLKQMQVQMPFHSGKNFMILLKNMALKISHQNQWMIWCQIDYITTKSWKVSMRGTQIGECFIDQLVYFIQIQSDVSTLLKPLNQKIAMVVHIFQLSRIWVWLIFSNSLFPNGLQLIE